MSATTISAEIAEATAAGAGTGTMPLIKLDGVAYSYRGQRQPVPALRRATGEFLPGRVYAIVGRSGSGKSTLLSLIGGLEVPDAGEIRFEGTPLRQLNLDSYRSRKVGMVFQTFNLLAQLTAIENVSLALEICGWPARERRSRATEVLSRVGIEGATATRRPFHLSGGEQQRVATARALAPDPPLVIADEPTGNLDEETGQALIDLLCRLAREDGRCVIVATHSDALARKADEVWFMRDGQLLPGSVRREQPEA
ncbi:MAG: ABC transporter ATP-binding protein [Bacillota bacterium]|nr:ABC transporter ATP-binding protein [Bacillota bacterium]